MTNIKMEGLVCPNCDSSNFSIENDIYTCKFCLSKFKKKQIDSAMFVDLRQANKLRQMANFDKAKFLYEQIIKNYPSENLTDIYWGLFLCDQKVIFETDSNKEQFPSFYSMVEDEKENFENSYFNKAISYALKNEVEKVSVFNDLGDKIFNAKKMYKDIQSSTKPYDVFICFKNTDDKTKEYTTDRQLAFDIYNQFASEYNIFFSEKTLKNIKSVYRDYEPNIYYGLYTAKVMLLLCSKNEYINSQWLKNEWSRFTQLNSQGNTQKCIIPIFTDNYKPSALPTELWHSQGIFDNRELFLNLSKQLKSIINPVDEIAELKKQREEERKRQQNEIENLKKEQEEKLKSQQEELLKKVQEEFLKKQLEEIQKQEKDNEIKKQQEKLKKQQDDLERKRQESLQNNFSLNDNQNFSQINSYEKRAKLFLEDCNYVDADKYVEKILDINPEYAPAYILKLLVMTKVKDLESLKSLKLDLKNNIYFKKAERFADENYLEKLRKLVSDIDSLISEEKIKKEQEKLNLKIEEEKLKKQESNLLKKEKELKKQQREQERKQQEKFNKLLENNYLRDGNNFLFGSYPQTLVKDNDLIEDLNSKFGKLPTKNNLQGWKDYNYIVESKISSFMFYKDIVFEDEKYRGVFFIEYRPYLTSSKSTINNSYQNKNGYLTNTIYWFKYEPIKWNILKEENGYATLICDKIIDSQEFNSNCTDKSKFNNNYENSTIRKWLNETFFGLAFNNSQMAFINFSNVDNSVASSQCPNIYACNDTKDNVYLLSTEEANKYFENNTFRMRQGSDYAKCQGLYLHTNSYSYWWLRSPRCSNGNDIMRVYYDGNYSSFYCNAFCTNAGILPAIKIKL